MGCAGSKKGDADYATTHRNVIGFPKCVEMGFVQGGDLLFIQDQMLIDSYSQMNTQTAHYLQKILRTKTKLDEHKIEHQWCRVAIVLDTEIKGMKKLLEMTEDGFVKNDFMSRVLYLKSQGNIFGIKRLRRPLTNEQSTQLNQLAYSFIKDFTKKSQMEGLYEIDTTEDDDDSDHPQKPAFGKKQKNQDDAIAGVGMNDFDQNVGFAKKNKDKNDGMDNFADLPVRQEDQLKLSKFAHVDILKNALKNTKSLLMDIDEDGLIFAQLWEIFRIFNEPSEEIDGEESFESAHSKTFQSVREGAQQSAKMMALKDVPWFIKYFKVADDDDWYFEQCINKMAAMADVESYVENGITFKHLLQELHECNFFINTQMTEAEPNSCFNAQIMMLILETIGLTDDAERMTGFFHDVNDLCENVEGRSAQEYERGQQEFAPFIYTPTLTVQTIY